MCQMLNTLVKVSRPLIFGGQKVYFFSYHFIVVVQKKDYILSSSAAEYR